MAEYYARIENGVVSAIHVVADHVVDDGGEQAGSNLLASLHGGEWVRFAKDGSIRRNRPNTGWTYDRENDAFIAPQPYASWTLNADYQWEAPVAHPTDGNAYFWDEDAGDWVAVPETPEV